MLMYNFLEYRDNFLKHQEIYGNTIEQTFGW